MKTFFLSLIALAATTTYAFYTPSETVGPIDAATCDICDCDCDCCLTSGCCLPGGTCVCDFDCCGPECSGQDSCCSDGTCDLDHTEVSVDQADGSHCEAGCCQQNET